MVIKQLRYLVALASEKHFARAAAVCHVSQPTLSAALHGLEEELGMPLVERGQRYIGLTPEGERVIAWARRILFDCDAMKQDVESLRGSLSGQLRLGVIRPCCRLCR